MSVEIGDLKPDPALWHEDNGRKPWENRRQDPPGSISGWHLGDAAHRLVANSLQLRANRNGYSNEEKKMCVKSAEVANQKHLEGVKKIAKLEASAKDCVVLCGRSCQSSFDEVALGFVGGVIAASEKLGESLLGEIVHPEVQEDSDENNSQIPLDGFMIQFNKNTFGLAAAGPLQVPQLLPGTSARTLLPMVLFQNVASGPPNTLLQNPQSNIDPLPLMKFQMRISMLFESTDADMKKILDDIRCVVQETQDSLHHHTMGCVFMESHCSDATCDRQACLEGTEVTEEKEMSLSKDSSINEELVAAVSWIHDFVLVLENEATAVQGTSPDGDVLSQKIQKFSATFDKVINSKISLLDFVLDLSCVLIKASELHFNVLGYKNNEAETNCSYCIDKVVLPENKVVRDILGDRYSNGCAHFSDSASDHGGSFISTFESNATTWKCLLKEFEQLKLEKDNMALDLESTKAQLQGTEQLLAKVKSQLASAQKLNSLAAEMYGRVIQVS
ncbi:unnamed protein product [Camellia sinensis]